MEIFTYRCFLLKNSVRACD